MEATIGPERSGDAAAVREVHRAAFPSAGEADLVERLRSAGKARISLVAREGDRVIGHVLFSPVAIEAGGARARVLGLGLAPLAVLPARQRLGVGAALVRAGLEACRHTAAGFVVVLGVPGYYERFGFTRASALGVGNEYGADDAFLAIELRPGALPAQGGLARYAPEFAELA